MSMIKAEYIWIDGTKPTPLLRSKTRIVEAGTELPIWGFDGSSTNQAPGKSSDCVLKPVYSCHDPIRGGAHLLVVCEVLTPDMEPHISNTRAKCVATESRYSDHGMWFGLEQEYTLFKDGRPYGWPEKGYPAPQGPYYCSVGGDYVYGRELVEEHLTACLAAGLKISGINAEVMPSQWEFQVGPLNASAVSDQLTIARWLLARIAEKYGVHVSYEPKPVKGDWNGAGCHTNFSTIAMRESYEKCIQAAQALGERHELHISNYGAGIEERLTGQHETCSYREYKYGVSDRGASVRIPWQVAEEGRGYIEDRRPAANCDPYVVTQLITETVCSRI
ncbi:MAG TPA: glutamine synthetase GlnII [Oligoflexus sp.]|uniref:glutamine synthetase GlnII n=1 Tax=Oligoflexus sp. TaxID=1971216 RepID=UPI002D7FB57E|nr:glutamine synthetase GlnII [Oligoflexus sp.]HET9238928.1 glutamine synthetase GlnII [Oligoflexus sp.]